MPRLVLASLTRPAGPVHPLHGLTLVLSGVKDILDEKDGMAAMLCGGKPAVSTPEREAIYRAWHHGEVSRSL